MKILCKIKCSLKFVVEYKVSTGEKRKSMAKWGFGEK